MGRSRYKALWHEVVERWLMLWIDVYDAIQTGADRVELWARSHRRVVRDKWLAHLE